VIFKIWQLHLITSGSELVTMHHME